MLATELLYINPFLTVEQILSVELMSVYEPMGGLEAVTQR